MSQRYKSYFTLGSECKERTVAFTSAEKFLPVNSSRYSAVVIPTLNTNDQVDRTSTVVKQDNKDNKAEEQTTIREKIQEAAAAADERNRRNNNLRQQQMIRAVTIQG